MDSIGIDVLTDREVLLGERYMLAPVVGEQMTLGEDNSPEVAYSRIDRDKVIEPNSVGRSTTLFWEDQRLETHLRVLVTEMTNEMYEALDRQRRLSGTEAIQIAQTGNAQERFLSVYSGALAEFYLSRATSRAWHELCRAHAK